MGDTSSCYFLLGSCQWYFLNGLGIRMNCWIFVTLPHTYVCAAQVANDSAFCFLLQQNGNNCCGKVCNGKMEKVRTARKMAQVKSVEPEKGSIHLYITGAYFAPPGQSPGYLRNFLAWLTHHLLLPLLHPEDVRNGIAPRV